MVKSGLITGAGAFMLIIALSVGVSPLCAVCVALAGGLAAGFLAGSFQRPGAPGEAARAGLGAGAIAGGVAVIAQVVSAVINAAILSRTRNPFVTEFLQLPTMDSSTFWVAQFIFGLCVGLLNTALMAGLGAAGAALWFQMRGPSTGTASDPA